MLQFFFVLIDANSVYNKKIITIYSTMKKVQKNEKKSVDKRVIESIIIKSSVERAKRTRREVFGLRKS